MKYGLVIRVSFMKKEKKIIDCVDGTQYVGWRYKYENIDDYNKLVAFVKAGANCECWDSDKKVMIFDSEVL